MQLISTLTGLALLLLTSACSTVIEGRTQTIAVDTFPSGASCLVKDNDLILARVQTPGTAVIEKSKNDILVECTKEGYISNKKRNRSDMALSSMGNMVMGQWSFLGNAVDSASGASHKYDSKVFMALNELPPVARMGDEGQGLSAPLPGAVTQDWAAMKPEQLTHELSRLLTSQNVVVTHQSPDEVIHQLMNNQPVPADNANGDAQQVAGLTQAMPIYHNAE